MADLRKILAQFGFVTVIEPEFFVIGESGPAATAAFKLDSLRVSNITQEGPTKEAKGGLYADTLMRYGKTMRLEMEDVIGRLDVLKYLMGADLIEPTGATGDEVEAVWITDKFPAAMRIEGKTFVIDPKTGNKSWVKLIVPKFLPDATFEMGLEAEGDFGVFNLGGEIQPDRCGRFYAIVAANADVDDCETATGETGE